MVGDSIRALAFQKAIHEIVKPGDVVVDVGTGTGLLAFFACQAGAARVYAIEKGEIVESAKEIAAANGYQERVIFLQGDAEAITLPEPVDVVVGELIGVVAFEENLLRLYEIVCQRSLKPGGHLIPQSITISFAPWEAPALHEEIDFWREPRYGLTLSPLRPLAMNHYYITILDGKGSLASPQPLWELPLPSPQHEPMLSSASFEIERAGLLHGFAGWFEADLSPSVRLSTSPWDPPTHWQHAFFPLETPLPVQPGDSVALTVSAAWAGEDVLWGWEGKVKRGNLKVGEFSAHTFRSLPLSLERVKTRSRAALPTRSEEGEIMLEILSGMNGTTSPVELAEQLFFRFPRRFESKDSALHYLLTFASRWGDRSAQP
jgi:protein arginine N-methyltransferase 1